MEADSAEFGELRVVVDSANALTLLRGLREDETSPLARLSDLTAIDRGPNPGSFEVVYRLDSVDRNSPVRVHVRVDVSEDEPGADASQTSPVVESVIGLWPAAAWLEREVFDLFGIRFRGHPELRRLLLDSEFEGAPLRKTFPGAVSHSLRPLRSSDPQGPFRPRRSDDHRTGS